MTSKHIDTKEYVPYRGSEFKISPRDAWLLIWYHFHLEPLWRNILLMIQSFIMFVSNDCNKACKTQIFAPEHRIAIPP